MGGYPDLNRKPTVPHTVALPIELHPPFYLLRYVGVIRTLNSKYQKFMTCRLVYNILNYTPARRITVITYPDGLREYKRFYIRDLSHNGIFFLEN